ncbi:hypothetical protein [Streptomyces bambusae]|uniref:Uncharacterized protein n=1 Tax=Streptomyces bambusae TaxID=1550616 RepID=A0ABS6Z0X4_9ACTN|nr:hypothetical protein [Streptomyces bambusae]MBW5481392.1 hypothetical protein [Streptomyces bambusae]
MRVDVAWWDLDGTGRSIDALAERLADEGIDAWTEVPGLVLKVWVSDRTANRWGAVMLWTERPDTALLPPNRAAELIGRPPAHRSSFEVEAAVEGVHPLATLHGLGAAFDLSQGVPSNA